MSISMRTEIKKRNDNKYNLWGFTVDPSYDPSLVDETNISFIPQRWIILDVFETYGDAVTEQQKYVNKKRKKSDDKGNQKRV